MPKTPWLTWLALGACHAPHQAPFDLIKKYDALFDARLGRRARAAARPPDRSSASCRRARACRRATTACAPGTSCPTDEQRLFTRLQAAYAAMLDHADQHLARLVAFLETAGQLDNTLVLVMSDNGASQEGGPFGMVNAMGPFNLKREPIEEKIARIDDIGGPDTAFQLPAGLGDGRQHAAAALQAEHPRRRHPRSAGHRLAARASPPRGELRHQFCHASDLAPTLLDVVGIKPPEAINGVEQMPIEGTSFASQPRATPKAPSKQDAAVLRDVRPSRPVCRTAGRPCASIRRATPSTTTSGSSTTSTSDFNEVDDLAEREPERLKAMIDAWWREAEAHQVLPLDDRFARALRRERQALPRAAQALRVPCRHGPSADRRRARRAQPQLHDRGRCPHRRAGDRGRADRPRRHDLRLRALHQGQPALLRHECRRPASPDRLGPPGAGRQPPARHAACASATTPTPPPC